MTKQYQTTTPAPENRAPHHNTPLEMAGLWLRVVCFVGAAVLIVVLLSFPPNSLREFRNEVIAVAVFMLALYGVVLGLYTRLEHHTAYGRREKQDKSTGGGGERVIYTHNEVKPKQGGGYTVKSTKHEARFTDGVREVARGVAWMLAHGKSDRRSVNDGLGWGPDKFSRIMRELEQFGMATNKGRGTGNGWQIDPKAHDWTKSLEAEIDDLADELDRW